MAKPRVLTWDVVPEVAVHEPRARVLRAEAALLQSRWRPGNKLRCKSWLGLPGGAQVWWAVVFWSSCGLVAKQVIFHLYEKKAETVLLVFPICFLAPGLWGLIFQQSSVPRCLRNLLFRHGTNTMGWKEPDGPLEAPPVSAHGNVASRCVRAPPEPSEKWLTSVRKDGYRWLLLESWTSASSFFNKR